MVPQSRLPFLVEVHNNDHNRWPPLLANLLFICHLRSATFWKPLSSPFLLHLLSFSAAHVNLQLLYLLLLLSLFLLSLPVFFLFVQFPFTFMTTASAVAVAAERKNKLCLLAKVVVYWTFFLLCQLGRLS